MNVLVVRHGETAWSRTHRKIHSGDREADAIDAAGLAQARERFALLGRDVSPAAFDLATSRPRAWASCFSPIRRRPFAT